MSIPVDLADLGAALSAVGPGYLLSTAGERVKAVCVEPALDGVELVVTAPGGGTRRNVEANAAVTLLFPPYVERGYSLIVDGEATCVGESAEGDVRVRPTHAVWHRPAAHADGPLPAGGCGHDCAPVAHAESARRS